MDYKKIVAATLCFSVAAGFSGCKNSEKDKEQIGKLIDGYSEAFADLDAEEVLELTSWDDDDDEYMQLLETFEFVHTGAVIHDYEAHIGSTIEIVYDIDDLEIKDKKAAISLEYEMIDWQPVYETPNADSDDLINRLKSVRDTVTVKGKLNFVLEDGEWKISKITNLDKVFEYSDTLPYFDSPIYPDPTTEPTVEPTEPSGTAFADSYDKAIAAFVDILYQEEAKIKYTEELYNMNSCCLYDVDGDGIPELFYISSEIDSDLHAGTLYVYKYNEYAGEAELKIVIPDIIYYAQGGGSFIIAITDDVLVFTYQNGEEALYSVYTQVYGHDLEYFWYMQRDVQYEYDPENDTENFTYTYYESGYEVNEEYYKQIVCYYADEAKVVIASNYTPMDTEPEYPLGKLPDIGFMTFEDLIDMVSVG